MFMRLLYDDALAQAAYLVGCPRSGQAIVIDPQRDVDRYIEVARRQKLRIVGVAETHIHADFLSGARELAEQAGATVYVSDEGGEEWKYQWLDARSSGGSYPHQLLRDGDIFRVGEVQFTVWHTPGHTPEHISFLITDLCGGAGEPMGIISGDFVFVGDLGRPDLLETAAGHVGVKESAARLLHRSARQFLKLPEYLQVWPGHGAGSACGKALGAVPQTTVGYEKRFNHALRLVEDEGEFVRNILEGQPEPPLYFARMKQQNKAGPNLLGALPRPRELAAADLAGVDSPSGTVLDTRSWQAFRAGHIPGALHAPINNQFPTVAGSFVADDSQIVLIVEPAQLDLAVRCLVRIGLDDVTGFATPATLEDARRAGLTLATSPEIDIASFKQRLAKGGALVLDVRRAAEHEAGHIAGALNIAHTRLAAHVHELPRDRPILVHCQGGVRSAFATALLQRHGFDATNVAGGFGAYEKAGGKVVRETVHA